MRGNLGPISFRPVSIRSIPARAGEPLICILVKAWMWVYPRTCGGTIPAPIPAAIFWGLSPHVRGNRGPSNEEHADQGSIPARAGEPAWQRIVCPVRGVYPRTCGEPRRRCSAGRSLRVYPRTCGGTSPVQSFTSEPTGLSPHVRGNHGIGNREGTTSGSIPARAGEPGGLLHPVGMDRVYPRTCGGTRTLMLDRETEEGLSPHVRGNLLRLHLLADLRGSIPARAGEP